MIIKIKDYFKENWKTILFWSVLPISIIVFFVIMFYKGVFPSKKVNFWLEDEYQEEKARIIDENKKLDDVKQDVKQENDKIIEENRKLEQETNARKVEKQKNLEKLKELEKQEVEIKEIIEKEEKEIKKWGLKDEKRFTI
jgi:uncharacterized protein YlxW (UPF0749 family)